MENKENIQIGDRVMMKTKRNCPLAIITDVNTNIDFEVRVKYPSSVEDRKSFTSVTKDPKIILLADIYRETLIRGKYLGEYTQNEETLLYKIREVIGDKICNKLDCCLED